MESVELSRSSGDLSTADSGGGSSVIARGTGDGLILRLPFPIEMDELEADLRSFLTARRHFVAGNEVLLEWTGSLPEVAFTERLEQGVFREFDVKVRANRLREVRVDQESSDRREGRGDKVIALSLLKSEGEQSSPLFSGIEALTNSHVHGKDTESVMGSLFEGLNGKVIFTTLRSGQRIESERSVVVFGDVNSGAEVIAGGSVIVLGALRGVAHAGAYEDSEGPAYIFALNLRPTQLRIGSVITRGLTEGIGSGSGEPEIARVDGSTILVEKYHPRVVMHRGPRSAPL